MVSRVRVEYDYITHVAANATPWQTLHPERFSTILIGSARRKVPELARARPAARRRQARTRLGDGQTSASTSIRYSISTFNSETLEFLNDRDPPCPATKVSYLLSASPTTACHSRSWALRRLENG